jgi:hypothetical protein
MAFSTSGALLEGVRVAQSANPLVYPPRSITLDSVFLNSNTQRSEYCVWVTGQPDSQEGIYIHQTSLKFYWTRNDTVQRFGYDGKSRRWVPLPGSSPIRLGVMSNIHRLRVPVPSESSTNYQIYLGLPRIFSFDYILVDSFGTPASGVVEILRSTGQLNFSENDLNNSSISSSPVYYSRDSFFDIRRYDGSISTIEADATYTAFMNPIPLSTEYPLLRVGYSRYLSAVSFPYENTMPAPSSSGTIHYALDTGRVLINSPSSHVGQNIFYDGVASGSASLSRFVLCTITTQTDDVNTIGISSHFVDLVDSERYVAYANKADNFYYLTVECVTIEPDSIDSGSIIVNTTNGEVYINDSDSELLNGFSLVFLDTYLSIDNGAGIKVYRSGASGSGNPNTFDFFEYYKVTDAKLIRGVSGASFVYVPSRPIDDSTLAYSVAAGTGSNGTFTGPLNKSTEPAQLGLGYTLDFKDKKFSFTNRKLSSKTLIVPTNAIKLDDAAIINSGITIKENSLPLDSTSYKLDVDSGSIVFLQSVGEDSPLNQSGLIGQASGHKWVSSTAVFSSSYVGSYLFVDVGPNAGFYRINTVTDPYTVFIDSSFPVSGIQKVDVKPTKEIIARYVWKNLNPPMKKIQIMKQTGPNTPAFELSQDKYSVIGGTGQITLVDLTKPGETYKVSYVSVDSPIAGLTVSDPTVPVVVTNTPRTEYLATKIRLEQATYIPGSGFVTINKDSRTIVPEKGFKVVVDGITLDSSKITYSSPDKLYLGIPLTTQTVYVDYYVAECAGGNKTFNLSYTPVLADYPHFIAKDSNRSVVLNGDLTNHIKQGALFVVNKINVYEVQSVGYDSTQDITSVVFTTEIINDYSGSFFISDPVQYFTVSNASETIASGSNSFVLSGQSNISNNSIIKLDDYPFYVASVSYSSDSNATTITLTTSVPRNFIMPLISVSDYPVVYPSKDFKTSKSLDIASTHTLFLSGPTSRILFEGSDYSISDGGSIKLTNDLSYGHTLDMTYVARAIKPAGTKYDFNYAYKISPDVEINGLLGQDLIGSYNLYSPDSFFYRIETILSYVPEVIDAIYQTGVQLSSGPSTEAVNNAQNKDYGIPSLYFNEQKYGNLDEVSKRLLMFYNDYINLYEDLLSNYDGRVVGGTNGKFRYDGNSRTVNTYEDIKNDIDDKVQISERLVLKSLFPLDIVYVPVYAYMYEVNSLSRLFPNYTTKNFVVNYKAANDIGYFEAFVGNVGVTSISSISTIKSAISVSQFTRINPVTISIPKNGDSALKVPGFTSSQLVNVCDLDGTPIGTNEILAITGPTNGPFILVMKYAVTLERGSIYLNNHSTDSKYNNRFYFTGTDISINYDSGDLKNITLAPLVTLNVQTEVHPNEILTASMSFANTSTGPKKVPALTGSTLLDNGLPSIPPLHRISELDRIGDELSFLSSVNQFTASVNPQSTVYNSNLVVKVNDSVIFLNGPNKNEIRSVVSIIDSKTFTVNSPFGSIDTTGSSIVKYTQLTEYKSVVNNLLGILHDNIYTDPVAPALVSNLDSELKVMDSIALYSGITVYNGTGSMSGSVLTDTNAHFTNTTNCYLLVQDGNNRGVYKIASSTYTTITVSDESPFYTFKYSGTAFYVVIQPYDFLSGYSLAYLAQAYKPTVDFYLKTYTWYNNVDFSLAVSRTADLNDRKAILTKLINKASGVCNSSEALYTKRFVWIQQRVDKKNGFLQRQVQSTSSRISSSTDLKNAQIKVRALMNI